MASLALSRQSHPADWASKTQDPAWVTYESVFDAAIAANVPFALGGAFGLATYIGTWRNTKDLDLFVLPRNRRRLIAVLDRIGFTDYYDQLPYDRRWIYRSTRDGVIVDVIWAMANQRAQVDEWWFSGPKVYVRGRQMRVVAAEAILWDKLYIMQRERCDWPDVMNLLYTQGATLEWETILRRLGNDTPLLAGALLLFGWLAPGAALRLPEWLWERLDIPQPQGRRVPVVDRRRAAFFDSRPWFAVQPLRKRAA
jgi:hypothetical protein